MGSEAQKQELQQAAAEPENPGFLKGFAPSLVPGMLASTAIAVGAPMEGTGLVTMGVSALGLMSTLVSVVDGDEKDDTISKAMMVGLPLASAFPAGLAAFYASDGDVGKAASTAVVMGVAYALKKHDHAADPYMKGIFTGAALGATLTFGSGMMAPQPPDVPVESGRHSIVHQAFAESALPDQPVRLSNTGNAVATPERDAIGRLNYTITR